MASLAEALTSTNFDPRFTLENIFPAYEIEFIDGSIQYRRDYLGADIVRTIKRIKDFTPYTFQGHEPLTTIAWDNYGTTTMMAVIMIYNGILHPLEMIPGSIIKLPNISELERKL